MITNKEMTAQNEQSNINVQKIFEIIVDGLKKLKK